MACHAGQHGIAPHGRRHGQEGAAERGERADDELLISGGSSHLLSAGTLLASMAEEHASRPMTTH